MKKNGPRGTKASLSPPAPTRADAPVQNPQAGGRGYEKNENNYIAQPGPNWGNRKGAGAKPGNRNALKTGIYTAKMRAQQAAIRAQITRMKILADLVNAHLDGKIDGTKYLTSLQTFARMKRPEFPR